MSATIGLSILSTTVDCDGTAVVVETTQHQGESDQDFEDRHWAAVDAKIAECSGTATAQPSKYTTPVDCNGRVNDVVTKQQTGQSRSAFTQAHNYAVQNEAAQCGS